MVDVPGEGFTLRLLALETCTGSGVSVGHFVDSLYAWDKKGRLVQALWIPGRGVRSVVTDASDGRPTLIAAETLDEGERLRRIYVRAIDVRTGVVRWRRKEKLHFGAACFTRSSSPDERDGRGAPLPGRAVVRLAAPQGAHLFDVDTGARLRAPDDELTPRNARQRKKPPASFAAPPVDLLPIYTSRRDPPGAPVADPESSSVAIARRAFFFGPTAQRRPWSRDACDPVVWQLVRELRALEGKPDIPGLPARLAELDLPPDVKALFAADSTVLKSRWRIDTKLAPTLAKEAEQRGAPRPVVVVGGESHPENPARPKLLCAQATDMGDRLGMFDGFGYHGPFPVATLLSEACWSVLEGRRSDGDDADPSCALMGPVIGRVLEVTRDGPPTPGS
ncbi:MAG: hypothetical protein R3B36_31755 [Polyangiaceae bacterium]